MSLTINAFRMKNICFVAIAAIISSCSPESSSKQLGPLPTASFTVTPMEGKPYKMIVKSTTNGGFLWRWNYRDTKVAVRETDTLSFAKQGEYPIQFTVFTDGGYATTSQNVTVTADAPVADILKGGDMEAGSGQYWTLLNTGGTQTSIQVTNGVMQFGNTGDSNGAIYQKLKVIPGREYTFSGDVKGTGATNTWFEVYFGTKAPAQGSDYSGTGVTKYIALNTWSGCGLVPFDGNLAEIGCDGDGKGKGGTMVFAGSDTTVYMVIKAGSAGGNMGTGITLDNVKFMEEQ
ncbi:hypothetical protein GCM10022209_16520 [Chitinophaga oryziterrae]